MKEKFVVKQAEVEEALAKKMGEYKERSHVAVEFLKNFICSELKMGNSVRLTGFGTFEPFTRKARNGFDPHTMAKMKVEAVTIAKFRTGKALKDCLKNKS